MAFLIVSLVFTDSWFHFFKWGTSYSGNFSEVSGSSFKSYTNFYGNMHILLSKLHDDELQLVSDISLCDFMIFTMNPNSY